VVQWELCNVYVVLDRTAGWARSGEFDIVMGENGKTWPEHEEEERYE
jgi:hypothetical protein